MKVSKGVISYKHDLESSKELINSTLRSIGEACLEVRKETAQNLFGEDYFDLDDEKQEAVDMAIPVWFSYERPKVTKPKLPQKKEPKTIKVHLNKNKLHFNGKFCKVDDLKAEVDSQIKGNSDIKVVELILHQPETLAKDVVEKVKKELKRVEGVEIKEMAVTVMDIKKKIPPPPKVLEVLPANQKYDEMPVVRFHEKWINVNGKRCEISNLKDMLGDLLPTDGSQRKMQLTVYSTVSKGRVEQVYAELESIDDLEIIRKDVTPPPPPKFVLKLYNDKVTLWDKEITMEEVSEKAKEFVGKAGNKGFVRVDIENNINAERIRQLKEELRKAGALNVNLRAMK